MPAAGSSSTSRSPTNSSQHLVNEVLALVVGEPGAGEDVEIGRWSPRRISSGSRDTGTGCGGGNSAPQSVAHAWTAPGTSSHPPSSSMFPTAPRCASEEIFGPVVTVETFADEEEAVRRAKAPALRSGRLGLDRERPPQP